MANEKFSNLNDIAAASLNDSDVVLISQPTVAADMFAKTTIAELRAKLTGGASGQGEGRATPVAVQSALARGNNGQMATLLNPTTDGNTLVAIAFGSSYNGIPSAPAGFSAVGVGSPAVNQFGGLYVQPITAGQNSCTIDFPDYASLYLMEVSGLTGVETEFSSSTPAAAVVSGFASAQQAEGLRYLAYEADAQATFGTLSNGQTLIHNFSGDGLGHPAVLASVAPNFFGPASMEWSSPPANGNAMFMAVTLYGAVGT